MRKFVVNLAIGVAAMMNSLASASPVGSTAQTLIPFSAQQITSVDCQVVGKSGAALAFKAQASPRRLRDFESALRSVGVNPDNDLDNLTFVSFHDDEQKLRVMAVASGTLSSAALLKKLMQQTLYVAHYRGSDLYALSTKMSVALIDDQTLLLGDDIALRTALDVRHGGVPALKANSRVGDAISLVQTASVWSVLARSGSQNMVLSALNDPSKQPDYESIKDSLQETSYTISFDNGLRFDLQMTTSDPETSARLAILLKSSALFKKVAAAPEEKTALASLKVSIDKTSLQMHFQADSKEFDSLLRAQFFAAALK